jgi:hypothetical protein
VINLDYPVIQELYREYMDPKRSESAAFLIWFLQHYYRLDEQEAIDCVCDQPGDRGIDGIYVNEHENTIDVFQSKLTQRPGRTVGDTSLKEFSGTLGQLRSKPAIESLITTSNQHEVARLIQRLDLANKVDNYELRGFYVCNMELDANGTAFLAAEPSIYFTGKQKLQDTYISDARTQSTGTKASFDITGYTPAEYIVDQTTRAFIAPIRAIELVRLSGISDQSLFAYNVRGPLGRTQVNKDIVSSIKSPGTHRLFPLFHNGITIICQKADMTLDSITIEDYFVVNGCQSLTSMYENQKFLTSDLRVLTKFIQMDLDSNLSDQVTHYSNNQNGVKARDFKANHAIQIRLQNEFADHYAAEYFYEVKRGELTLDGERITNEEAGLYLMAFDLKEPWATHRKYQVFDERYNVLFARPEVTADRIVMLHVLMKLISNESSSLRNGLFGKYILTRYFILYVLRQIFENDSEGSQVIKNPAKYVRGIDERERFETCVRTILKDIVIDLNAEVAEYGDDFDYRGQLRDQDWVKEKAKAIVSSYLKLVQRTRVQSFESLWSEQLS